MAMALNELQKLFIGIGVQLADEAEQLAASLLLEAPAQGDGESMQVVDGSSPQGCSGAKCRD
jgi:hypothetical protein